MRSKHGVVEGVEHVVSRFQIKLEGVLGDPVWVFWPLRGELRHWQLRRVKHASKGCEIGTNVRRSHKYITKVNARVGQWWDKGECDKTKMNRAAQQFME